MDYNDANFKIIIITTAKIVIIIIQFKLIFNVLIDFQVKIMNEFHLNFITVIIMVESFFIY